MSVFCAEREWKSPKWTEIIKNIILFMWKLRMGVTFKTRKWQWFFPYQSSFSTLSFHNVFELNLFLLRCRKAVSPLLTDLMPHKYHSFSTRNFISSFLNTNIYFFCYIFLCRHQKHFHIKMIKKIVPWKNIFSKLNFFNKLVNICSTPSD